MLKEKVIVFVNWFSIHIFIYSIDSVTCVNIISLFLIFPKISSFELRYLTS